MKRFKRLKKTFYRHKYSPKNLLAFVHMLNHYHQAIYNSDITEEQDIIYVIL